VYMHGTTKSNLKCFNILKTLRFFFINDRKKLTLLELNCIVRIHYICRKLEGYKKRFCVGGAHGYDNIYKSMNVIIIMFFSFIFLC
jgi:hypothetical protein